GTSKGLLGLVLIGGLLVGGSFTTPLAAQDSKRPEAGAPYPNGSEVAFEWQYSCTSAQACSFNCSGSGGASSVKKLSIQLMTIPLGSENVAGIFYEYSTVEVARANGFNITTGISRLACQVNGMNLDYAGAPKTNQSPAEPAKKNPSAPLTSSIAR
ncbi:MAG: hypothetical protein JO022_07755, partial [Acidobacteriaceae bacterium]|nr:hypothetical protein [Acidobacteriaceae bacterium]